MKRTHSSLTTRVLFVTQKANKTKMVVFRILQTIHIKH